MLRTRAYRPPCGPPWRALPPHERMHLNRLPDLVVIRHDRAERVQWEAARVCEADALAYSGSWGALGLQ